MAGYIASLLIAISTLSLVNGTPIDRSLEQIFPAKKELNKVKVKDLCHHKGMCGQDRIADINQNYVSFAKNHVFMKEFDMVMSKPKSRKRKRIRRTSKNVDEWPKNPDDGFIYIPYAFSSREDEERLRFNLTRAIAEFNEKTCIRLIPRTNEYDYIYITDYSGCWSYIGKQGGRQYLSLSPRCETKNTIEHEFLHAIGFYHEQTRRDRDKHIRINWSNIASWIRDQFILTGYGNAFVNGQPYDFKSIMQYGRTAGAKDKRIDAMTPIQFPNESLGAKDDSGFSKSDIIKLNRKTLCKVGVKVYDGRHST